MKRTIENILFHVSLFIAREDETVTNHTLIDGRIYRRRNRTYRVFNIPVKQFFITEWVA